MFRKIVHTLATQIGGTAALVLLGIVLARVLGPAGRGVVSYTWIVLGFALIFAEGQASAVVAQYAREKYRRIDVHRAAGRVLAVLTVPAVAIVVALALALPTHRALLAVACALPFALYTQIAKGILIAEGRVQAANVVDIVTNGGYAAFGAAVVLAQRSVNGALAAWVVAYAAAALSGYLLIRRGRGRDDATIDETPAALSRRQLVFAGKSGFVYAAGYLNLRVDVFVVMAMLGTTALGVYTLATGTAELLWKLSNAIAWSSFGHIAGDDDDAVRELVPTITRGIVLIEGALGILVFVAGPALLVAVYGHAFAAAGTPLRVLLLGIAAYAMEPIFGYFLVVRECRPLTVLAIQAASAVLCGTLAWLLIPRVGLAGAAAASTATYVAVVIVKAWLVARALHLPVSALFVPRREDMRAIAARLRVARGAAA